MSKDNTVKLIIDGDEAGYSFWESVSITSELNSLARSFSLGITAKLPNSINLIKRFTVGTCVQITIGDELIATGYIFQTPLQYNATSVSARIEGRSKTADLVDSSVMTPGTAHPTDTGKWSTKKAARASGAVLVSPASSQSVISWKNQKIEKIIADLVAPYSIDFIKEVSIAELEKTASFDAVLTNTVHKSLQDLTKSYDLIFCDNENGELVATKRADEAGGTVVDTLILGENVIDGHADFNGEQLYRTYRVNGQQSGTNTSFGSKSIAPHKGVEDTSINRPRLLCEQAKGQGDPSQCEKEAEGNKKYHKALFRKITYKLTGWRNSSGDLWRINTLVHVEDKILGIDSKMGAFLITKVTFDLNNTDGMITTLDVIPPDGFKIETEQDNGKQNKTKQTKSTKQASTNYSWINGKTA